MNVACLGVRSVQLHNAASNFTKTVDVQLEALKQVQRNNPNGRWWVKADACDVRSGLRESVRGEWSGDEDFGSGALQLLFQEYKARCKSVRQLNIETKLFEKMKSELLNDLKFLDTNGKQAKDAYQKAVDIPGKKESTLMGLAWSVTGYETLSKQANEFISALSTMAMQINDGEQDKVKKPLLAMKPKLLEYLHGLYTKKRTPATHLLVFMISDELRNRKPYAMPVRFMPYRSISDCKMRELELELECVMKKLERNVVGMLIVSFKGYIWSKAIIWKQFRIMD